jgi:hypothetical protein
MRVCVPPPPTPTPPTKSPPKKHHQHPPKTQHTPKPKQVERAARPALFAETSLGDYVDNHRCRLASEGEMVPTPKEYVSTLQVRL